MTHYEDTLPQHFGDYVLLRRLATGGMAEIFLAKQVGPADFARLVVIKRMQPALRAQADFVRMFLDEARVAARVNHPNVVQLFFFGEAEGVLFQALEYVFGEDLHQVFRACAAAGDAGLPLPILCRIFADLCAATHHVHTLVGLNGAPLHLVHRDLSPQNVLVGYGGVVKLLDFGVAQGAFVVEAEPGQLKGKLAYLSPEQATGLPLDHRSDLFSLGVCLWELACGRRLFRRDTADATIDAVVQERVEPPSAHNPALPPELDALVLRALSKNPAERPASAREMGRALESLARGRGIEVDAESVGRWLCVRFADKLAARQRLAHDQKSESFEKLLLEERTETIPSNLLGSLDIDWGDVFLDGI